MTTWTQDIAVKRESRRWIQMMSKYQNNIMWVIIPCGNWQKIKKERMMIFRIIQVMGSPTKKGEEKKKKKTVMVFGEKNGKGTEASLDVRSWGCPWRWIVDAGQTVGNMELDLRDKANKKVMLLSPSLLCSQHDRPINWESKYWGKEYNFIRKAGRPRRWKTSGSK